MKKYDNFVSQLRVLRRASDEDLSNEFVMSGIASKFALQFELTWKLLKECLAYEGRRPGVAAVRGELPGPVRTGRHGLPGRLALAWNARPASRRYASRAFSRCWLR